MRLCTTFRSVADPNHELVAVIAADRDLHLRTTRLNGEGHFQNAQVRLRTSAGGGSNLLLRDILEGLVAKGEQESQPDMFAQLYAACSPHDFQIFRFRCDDNPGSHIKIAIAENLFGLQTNCHDEEQDRDSGGYLSVEGEGPMVWLNKDLLPKVYDDLQSFMLNNKKIDPIAYGDRAFSPLKLEAA